MSLYLFVFLPERFEHVVAPGALYEFLREGYPVNYIGVDYYRWFSSNSIFLRKRFHTKTLDVFMGLRSYFFVGSAVDRTNNDVITDISYGTFYPMLGFLFPLGPGRMYFDVNLPFVWFMSDYGLLYPTFSLLYDISGVQIGYRHQLSLGRNAVSASLWETVHKNFIFNLNFYYDGDFNFSTTPVFAFSIVRISPVLSLRLDTLNNYVDAGVGMKFGVLYSNMWADLLVAYRISQVFAGVRLLFLV